MNTTDPASPATPTPMDPLPVLYTKPGCPWCEEVTAFLDEHGIPYRDIDITADTSAADALRRKSGQGKVPTLDWHGKVLADFGVEELVPFLRAREVKLEDN